MTYRVIKLASGEAFATFSRHQLEDAVAAALDLARIVGQQFVVVSPGAVILFKTPPVIEKETRPL